MPEKTHPVPRECSGAVRTGSGAEVTTDMSAFEDAARETHCHLFYGREYVPGELSCCGQILREEQPEHGSLMVNGEWLTQTTCDECGLTLCPDCRRA